MKAATTPHRLASRCQNRRRSALKSSVGDRDLAKIYRSAIFSPVLSRIAFPRWGMAEQLLMGAAGGGERGIIPFATTYAAFATRRAYDFIHQASPKKASEREDSAALPGLTTGYGSSHRATEDLAIMRGIPGMVIVDPDALEIEQAVPAIADHNGPVYMRSLRGKVPLVLDKYDHQFELGKAKLLE